MNQVPNMLIVDDVKINIVLLEIITRKITVNIIKALSGNEALEKSKGIDLALAIIDVRMPVMSGYELAIKLNEERALNKVPIIFMTAGYANDNELLEGYKTGAVDYLLKPIEPSILLSKISVFLELHNYKKTIQREAVQLGNYADELTRVNLALKMSEEKYRRYIDNAPDGVFVVDISGNFLDVNFSASRITGYTRDELLKMSFLELVPDDYREEGKSSFRNLVNSGKAIADLPIHHKTGEIKWLSINAIKLDESQYIGFTKDVTLRKQMEDVMLEQQVQLEIQNLELTNARDNAEEASKKYLELYDSAPSCYYTLSRDYIIQELNQNGARMLERNRSELLGAQFDAFISRNSLPVFKEFFQFIFRNSKKEVCELILVNDDGTEIYVHAEGRVIVEGSLCQVNLVDITPRKQAEETLKISEEKYRTMLNTSPDGILLLTLDGIVTETSIIALEMLGIECKEDVLGKNISMFVPPDETETLKDIFERTLNEGLVQNIVLKIRKINQVVFPSETSVTLIQGSDMSPLSFMFIARDISMRTRMEAAQIHAARMASLGEMASGIAHEINQPLNIISMVMDKILFESAKKEVIEADFLRVKSDKIFENITRIRNIIDHVRTFSRSNDGYVSSSFDVNSTIENAISMISEQFKYLGISIIHEHNSSLPQCLGNTSLFEQVVLNILINAKDALVEKRKRDKDGWDMIIKVDTFRENRNINIEISDNGTGINKDDIQKVMLPFFTTKEAGKGTGLGLSICYQIINGMGGNIEICSDQVSGTKVKIVLNYQKEEL